MDQDGNLSSLSLRLTEGLPAREAGQIAVLGSSSLVAKGLPTAPPARSDAFLQKDGVSGRRELSQTRATVSQAATLSQARVAAKTASSAARTHAGRARELADAPRPRGRARVARELNVTWRAHRSRAL
jgi:hypothetical protein